MIKKIIIIFSLVLSILFINVTPVYCSSNTVVNVYIEDFDGDLSTLNVFYKYPFIRFNQYGVRELDGKQYLTFTYSNSFSNIEDELSLYIGDEEEVEIESISSTGDEIYINPIFKTTEPEPTPPEEPEEPEDTESTETLTPPPTTDEEEPTTPPSVDVVVDTTEVVEELKEIKSYIIMFFGLFFLYFSYKIIKEISNNTRRF